MVAAVAVRPVPAVGGRAAARAGPAAPRWAAAALPLVAGLEARPGRLGGRQAWRARQFRPALMQLRTTSALAWSRLLRMAGCSLSQ